MRRLANLARLTAELVAGGALAPTVLKAVDFSAALAPRELLLWRAAFTHLLAACRCGCTWQEYEALERASRCASPCSIRPAQLCPNQQW